MRLKRFLYLLLITFTSLPASYAQSAGDVLLNKIAHSPNDTAKLSLYKDAVTYYKRVDMDTAYKLADDGLRLAEKLSAKKQQAFMLLQKGGLDREQGRMGLASININSALEMYTQLNEKRFIALATNELGVINGIRGNYTVATELFLSALKYFESTADTQGLGQTYIKLGTVHDKMNNVDKAMMFYQKALTLSKAKKDSINLTYLYINMGILEGKAQNKEATFRYFDSALALCTSEKFNNVKISLLLNSGVAYAHTGDQQKAHEQFSRGLALAREGNMPFDIPNLLLNMAQLDKVIAPAQRVPMLKEALLLSKELGDKSLEGSIYQTLSDVFAENGDFQQAYHYLDTGDNIEQELTSAQKNTEIGNLQALYELDKSKNKVHELELLNIRRLRERTGIIIISAVLLILLFSVTRSYRRTKMLNEKLAVQQQELANANSVKDKIFSIIGHDLRAPLSTLLGMLAVLQEENGQLTHADRKEIYASLQEQGAASLDTLNKLLFWGSRQIKGISLEREQFDMQKVVAENIRLLSENAAAKQITIHNKIKAEVSVHADVSQVDFVVRNLLFNAIKYTGRNGTVTIGTDTTAGADDEVVFYVKDTGIGIDSALLQQLFTMNGNNRLGTNNEKGTGLGLILCKGFLEQNGGRIWVESQESNGTTFWVALKKNA